MRDIDPDYQPSYSEGVMPSPLEPNREGKWEVQIHGAAESSSFEISVINTEKVDSAQRHYGWFNENKLLITHNGGPCHWPLTKRVWHKMVKVAHEVADELNER